MVINEAKRLFPDCTINPNQFQNKTFSVSMLLKDPNRKEDLMWWLMEYLGKRGWEPFAISGEKYRDQSYYFRSVLEE